MKIQRGDWFKTEGLTYEECCFLADKMLEAGAKNAHEYPSSWLDEYPYIILHWKTMNICTTNMKGSGREIKLEDFPDNPRNKNNNQDFPDFDFKLSCGDDPLVREWLKQNGCEWRGGQDLTTFYLNDSHLLVRVNSLIVTSTTNMVIFDSSDFPEISPKVKIKPLGKLSEIVEFLKLNPRSKSCVRSKKKLLLK